MSGTSGAESSVLSPEGEPSPEPEASPPSPNAPKKLRNKAFGFALGLLLLPLALVLAFVIDSRLSAHQVPRGVWVLDAELSGFDQNRVEQVLGELNQRLRARVISARVGQQIFELAPAEIEASLDVPATAARALSSGKQGGFLQNLGFWLSRFRSPYAVKPAVLPLAEPSVQALLETWEKKAVPDPPFEGAILVQENKPVADYPRRGHGIDRKASVLAIEKIFAEAPPDQKAEIDLPLAEIQPERDKAGLDAALSVAQKLLSSQVILKPDEAMLPKALIEQMLEPKKAEEAEPPKKKSKKKRRKRDESEAQPSAAPALKPLPELLLRMETADLAKAFRARPTQGDAQYELYFDPETIAEKLAPLKPYLEQPARDASFDVDSQDRITIVPGQPGTRMPAEKIAKAVYEAALSETRTGLLLIEEGDPPEFTVEAAQALKIEGLVSKATTHHPCCQERVKNIHRIADLVNGRIVRPGQTFSLNEAVGERTAKNGFVMAPGIEDGEMVDTMGGGVSQFATTFFNAMFHGGYEIIERQPHSFYFSRYPMGHEATLSWPKPDLIIRNDTESGILIKTIYDKTSITIKLYGNNGGRKIQAKVSRKYDITKPREEYLPNPKLSPGKSKVKESGSVGWSVTVSRIITFVDGTKKEESRKVIYKPRPRRVFVHPCRIPEGEPGHTGEKCPEPEEGESGETDSPGAEPPVLSEDAPAPF